jgi:hypothetical protein
LIGELEARPHQRQARRHLARLQLRHAGRVEVDGAGVLGHRGRAGVGVADAAGVLFGELETGGRRRAGNCGQHQRRDEFQGKFMHLGDSAGRFV